MAELEIPLDGYSERLVKVQQRNKIFASRADNLLDLSIEEQDINNELDELVKEGLRLYLQGEGVELLYYLKYKRDQFIERYLNEKFNPEHYLF